MTRPTTLAIPFAGPFAIALAGAFVLSACAERPAPADATAPVATTPAPSGSGPATPASTDGAAATRASATGTVESVDAAAGKITIAHDPVASLDWPAMTMRFKASPEQIASVQPGQAIRFEFDARGMDGTIVAIEPAD